MHLKQGTILAIHLVVAAFLSYLAYMIINKKKIPILVGILIAFLAIGAIAVQVYFYWSYRKYVDSKQQGLSFPKDKKYDPIGGIGGTGWL